MMRDSYSSSPDFRRTKTAGLFGPGRSRPVTSTVIKTSRSSRFLCWLSGLTPRRKCKSTSDMPRFMLSQDFSPDLGYAVNTVGRGPGRICTGRSPDCRAAVPTFWLQRHEAAGLGGSSSADAVQELGSSTLRLVDGFLQPQKTVSASCLEDPLPTLDSSCRSSSFDWLSFGAWSYRRHRKNEPKSFLRRTNSEASDDELDEVIFSRKGLYSTLSNSSSECLPLLRRIAEGEEITPSEPGQGAALITRAGVAVRSCSDRLQCQSSDGNRFNGMWYGGSQTSDNSGFQPVHSDFTKPNTIKARAPSKVKITDLFSSRSYSNSRKPNLIERRNRTLGKSESFSCRRFLQRGKRLSHPYGQPGFLRTPDEAEPGSVQQYQIAEEFGDTHPREDPHIEAHDKDVCTRRLSQSRGRCEETPCHSQTPPHSIADYEWLDAQVHLLADLEVSLSAGSQRQVEASSASRWKPSQFKDDQLYMVCSADHTRGGSHVADDIPETVRELNCFLDATDRTLRYYRPSHHRSSPVVSNTSCSPSSSTLPATPGNQRARLIDGSGRTLSERTREDRVTRSLSTDRTDGGQRRPGDQQVAVSGHLRSRPLFSTFRCSPCWEASENVSPISLSESCLPLSGSSGTSAYPSDPDADDEAESGTSHLRLGAPAVEEYSICGQFNRDGSRYRTPEDSVYRDYKMGCKFTRRSRYESQPLMVTPIVAEQKSSLSSSLPAQLVQCHDSILEVETRSVSCRDCGDDGQACEDAVRAEAFPTQNKPHGSIQSSYGQTNGTISPIRRLCDEFTESPSDYVERWFQTQEHGGTVAVSLREVACPRPPSPEPAIPPSAVSLIAAQTSVGFIKGDALKSASNGLDQTARSARMVSAGVKHPAKMTPADQARRRPKCRVVNPTASV